MSERPIQVAVIGAGIAGMSAAAQLSRMGLQVQVFDKARGPGGRTASRRQEPLRFDHGAPYFEVQDPGFAKVVSAWEQQDLVTQWVTTIGTQGPQGQSKAALDAYVAVPKMSALARAIGQGVTSHYSTRIAALTPDPQGWKLTDTESQHYLAKQVLLTAPPPQTLDLLAAHAPEISSALSQVQVCPDWTLMLTGQPELLAPELGHLTFQEHPCLAQLTAEHRKPQRPSQAAWTLHATSSWSRTHEEAEPAWVIEQLCGQLAQSLGQPLNFDSVKAHRWRYARVRANVPAACLPDPKAKLYYAGDACLRGDLESAYLSGVAAAAAIEASLA